MFKGKGSFIIYALVIIFLFLIAYAFYFFAKLNPVNPNKIKSQYEDLYVQGGAEERQRVNQSDFEYGQDLYAEFGNRVEDPNHPQQTTQTTAFVGTEISQNKDIQEDARDQQQQSKVSTENTPITATTSEEGASSQSDATVSDVIALDDVFTSKINKQLSFPVPKGAKVIEKGEAKDLSLHMQLNSRIDLNMTVKKVIEGCYNPLLSFAIPGGIGVDYRILYGSRQVVLPNTYRAVIGTEEYGTYDGSSGFRGTSCIQSAVPTRIEVRTAGWKKTEKDKAFQVLEDMLSHMDI